MIESICFDVGGVLSTRERRKDIQDYLKDHLGTLSFTDYEKILKFFWRPFCNGIITPEEYLHSTLSEAGFEPTLQNKEHLSRLLELYAGDVCEKMFYLVQHLQRHGYSTSILTNNNALMYPRVAGVFESLISPIVSSHLVGISKPSPEIYNTLLERLGNVDPQTILFIDDKQRNTDAAAALGFQTFVFRSKEVPIDEAVDELVNHLTEQDIL